MLKIQAGGHLYLFEATEDKLLSEIAATNGIMLDLRCAGFGVCGRCNVDLISGSFSVNGEEIIISSEPIRVPACHTKAISTDAEISIPSESLVHTDGQIAVDFDSSKYIGKKAWTSEHGQISLNGVNDWIASRRSSLFSPLGLAIDIGTTTVAIVLADLETDKALGSASAYNRQSICGDNVASRISYASYNPNGLERLQKLIIKETLNPLIKSLLASCGKKSEDIIKVSIAGNTVMTHIAVGLSPESIGQFPFTPLYRKFPALSAASAGLEINPDALVICSPAVSGYIGGDITAGMISTGQYLHKGKSLLIDIGTNCEIALHDNGKFFATAAAAGPAFEGAGIACGSRAASGAIDKISIDEKLNISFTTIEDSAPAGLCGSGMLDFLAEAFRSGMLDSFGRYNIPVLKQIGRHLEINYGKTKVHACSIAKSPSGKDIYVSESDIEQILKAKAAVYAGIETLLAERKIGIDELDIVWLCGGFAKYMNIESALKIGMFPDFKTEQLRKTGNSSLSGAMMNLYDPDFQQLAEAIADKPETVELNTLADFENNYIDALMIPNFKSCG